MRIERQEHYGVQVETNVAMDELRRDQCLCLNCKDVLVCSWAKTLKAICEETSLAMAVTRCPEFNQLPED